MHPTPLTYVYLYAPNDMPDDEVERRTVDAENYASTHHYGIFKIFYEWDRRQRPALTELVTEIGRLGGEYVIIPSLRDFSDIRMVRDAIVRRLTDEAHVTVIVMDGEHD
jgi:hypothetical protein